MTRGLRIADDLELPLGAVTQPMGILAARRAGKSNAAVVLAEQMFAAGLHWVAIDPKGDWWGIRSSGDGKGKGLPVPILGGEHADMPLEPGAGAFVADLVVDQRLTCLLDVSGFASEADKIRFLLAFGDRLFRRKAQSQEPTHVFFEEADDYVPQRAFPEQARLVHVMSRILKQGGSRGLGGTVISQRSAVVHKDILSQIQTLFALRTTGPHDRKAIRDWVSFSGENPEIVETLASLADGEAWIWSPSWLRVTKRFQFRRRSTFDSGATPEVGQSRRPPATLADVDLTALTARMAATIEKAKADDPRELRKRISDLEKQLRMPAPEVEVVEKIVEVPVLNGQVDELRDVIGKLEELAEPFLTIAKSLNTVAETIVHAIARVESAPRPAQKLATPVTTAREAPARREAPRSTSRPSPSTGGMVPASAQPSGNGADARASLGPTDRAVLATLASFPEGRTQKQVAILSGYSAKSGGFFGSLAKLRKHGLIVGGSSDLRITDEGLGALGPFDPLPSGRDLIAYWIAKLPKAEGTILSALIDAGPGGLSQDELGVRTGYSTTSGGFFGALAKLRVLRLIEGGKAGLYAVADLVDAR